MAKLTINDITAGYASNTALNTAFTAIETALENTVSRDGTSPNQMGANLDMNGYAILNQRATSGNENFLWLGTWVTGAAYVVNNLVYAPEGTNLGNTLICVTAHTAGATLDGDAAKWAVFAQRGATGGGSGDVDGPISSTLNYLPQWSDTTGTALKAGVPIGSGGVQAYSANLATLSSKTYIDDDTMATASATAIPSSESVKAYADNLISTSASATPDLLTDTFLFEDATDTTQKKALLYTLNGALYTSGTPTTYASPVAVTETHSLGFQPTDFTASLRCTTAERGYSIGDEITAIDADSPTFTAMTLWASPTQVGVSFGGTPRIYDKGTTASFAPITPANWSIILRIFR